jgi:hypothetical protein
MKPTKSVGDQDVDASLAEPEEEGEIDDEEDELDDAGRPRARGASRRPIARKSRAVPLVATIRIVVEPWGQVFVDGVSMGNTPVVRTLRAKPGPHTVEVRHPALGSRKKTVEFGQQTSVKFVFE